METPAANSTGLGGRDFPKVWFVSTALLTLDALSVKALVTLGRGRRGETDWMWFREEGLLQGPGWASQEWVWQEVGGVRALLCQQFWQDLIPA